MAASSKAHPDWKSHNNATVLHQRDSMKQAMHPPATLLPYPALRGERLPVSMSRGFVRTLNIFLFRRESGIGQSRKRMVQTLLAGAGLLMDR